jgi:tetratricopeptide (TPR) repeat protein
MARKVKPGKQLELRVANAYRQMGARKVEHDLELAGNQIDVYVELATPGDLLHRIAVEVKDWSSPVGIDVINRFGQIVKLLHGERLIDEGIIVSAGGFSRPARNAAKIYGIRLLEPRDLQVMCDGATTEDRGWTNAPPILSPPTPYLAHPYALQENFTGRIHERQMLTKWLTGKQQPVSALVAIGGMGKSALTWVWLQRDVLGQPLPGLASDPPEAVERCRVSKAECPEGVLWWSFYEVDSSFALFLDKALAYASGGSLDSVSNPSVHDKVRSLVNLLQKRRLLLVLDGFERELRAYASLSAVYQGDEVVEDTLGNYRACTDPHASNFLRWVAALPLQSRILLTSRLLPRELEGVAGCQREDLTGLAPEDAVVFFRAQGVQGTRAEIEAACGRVGYHPLTLRLLAGMITNDPARPGDVAVAASYSPVDDLVPREHHILALAYDSLNQPFRELLSRLAAFRSPVEYEIAATLNPFEGRRELGLAFRELMNRGLIYFDEERWHYDLHPIVRKYAYDRLADKDGVHNRLRSYLATMPTLAAMNVENVEDLAPQIELYHHTVHAGKYEDALELYRERLADPLFYRLGAYQMEIDLLHALFPNGKDLSCLRWAEGTNGSGQVPLPRLKEKSAQAWTLNALASSYSRSGQPRCAVPLLEVHYALREKLKDKTNLAIGLKNLASVQLELGELAAAEKNLRRSIELGDKSGEDVLRINGHQELGRLLAYMGAFDEAEQNLDTATEIQIKIDHVQSEGRTWTYRAQRALLMGQPRAALDAARKALRKAKEAAKSSQFVYSVRDFVWAHWLLGAAHLALSHLLEAETHLSAALTRCRHINLVELESDLLLAWARWHHEKETREQSREYAEEALSIADRCEYRLKQAEIHNFLAQWELDAGNAMEARKHARVATERARCDGLPHCYKSALEEAEWLLERTRSAQPSDASDEVPDEALASLDVAMSRKTTDSS